MRLISLNLEGHKHFEAQLDFFKRERPDILCLQEAFEPDVECFSHELGMKFLFASMCTKKYTDLESGDPAQMGVAIFSTEKISASRENYYAGSRSEVVPFNHDDWASMQRVLLTAQVGGITIGTTHFTWSPRGEATDLQRRDATALLGLLEQYPSIAFCGDLNAPRGGEIFHIMASRYKDHIPPGYKTSIDEKIHVRGGSGELSDKMVDGLFSIPDLEIRDVRLQNGVSDHCAIVASVS